MANNGRKITPEHIEISEMMKNKQSRCEDWVAAIANVDEDNVAEDGISVASDSTYKEEELKIPIDDEYDDNEEDPLSESVISNHKSTIIKTPDLRGIPEGHSKARQKLNILLCCEWIGCTYMTNGNDKTPMDGFVKHVMGHLKNLRVVEYEDESRVYKCDWQDCDHTTTCNSEIKRHLSMHAIHIFWEATAVELHNKWKFQVCQKIECKENEITDIESSFICETTMDCSFSTDNFYDFLKHVENDLLHHINSNDKPFSCIWKGGCNFKSNSPAGIKIHMKKHTGEKKLMCPTCKSCFTSTTKYVDHCTKDVPIRDESNQCQFCLRFYANERLLRDHMRYHINSHKCSFCGMTFSTPNVLSNHIRLKHLDYRPFECLACGFRSIKAIDHNRHLKIHKEEFEYKCTFQDCAFQCRTSRTFKNHIMKHNNQKKPIYKCHLCTKEFMRGDILGKHLRVKHNLERLPGHTRFRYMVHKDGYFRVQIERYESTDIEDVKASPQVLDSNQNKNIYVKQEDSSERQSPTKLTIKLDNLKPEKNEDNLQEMDEDSLQEMNENNLQEMDEDSLQEMNEDNFQEMNEDNLQEMNEDNLQEMNDDNLQEMNEDNLEEMNENSLQEENEDSLEIDTSYNEELPPIIMIDEIDENGRLIRSNPITKELSMESLPECAQFVDAHVTDMLDIKNKPDDGTTIVRLRKRKRKTKFGDLDISAPHEIVIKHEFKY